MKTIKTLSIASCLFSLALMSHANARPVSYPEGWTVMQMNDANRHSLHIHYSPTAKYSVGYKAEYFRHDDWQFHGGQLNYLAKRWNGSGSQANIYLKSAAGLAYSDDKQFNSRTEAAAMVGISGDWETRRYFTSYENRYVYAGNIDRFFTQEARIGIAPYIGDYGDIHTWLMLKAEHRPSQRDSVSITPLLRLFKGDYMAEAGLSDNSDVLFNWIVRF